LSAAGCKRLRLSQLLWGLFFAFTVAAQDRDQDNETRHVVVEAEELPTAYGAPPDLSRGRLSTLTKAYVLPPFGVELENIYEGDFFGGEFPYHLFTTEIEFGLPARFTIGLQEQFDRFNDQTRQRSVILESRYALADWDKIPFNPTVAAEYRFGFSGHSDEFDYGLLFCRDFAHMIEWAANISGEKTFDRSNRNGFRATQTCEVPVLLPDEKLEIGVEMQYEHPADSSNRSDRLRGFAIGPTLAWRPAKTFHVDLCPLIGCTGDTPRVQFFAAVSFSFGGPKAHEAEKPISAEAH
jgi:hypothetical protein